MSARAKLLFMQKSKIKHGKGESKSKRPAACTDTCTDADPRRLAAAAAALHPPSACWQREGLSETWRSGERVAAPPQFTADESVK